MVLFYPPTKLQALMGNNNNTKEKKYKNTPSYNLKKTIDTSALTKNFNIFLLIGIFRLLLFQPR